MKIRNNIKGMRFGLLELSGSFGDLGTFIPLIIAVVVETGMDIGIILIFAGLFNVLSGLAFGLPIPVQPMKAIAAVAIAEQLLPSEIAAAGFMMGLILLFLSSTRLLEKLEKIIPLAVVRGIQLGIALKLALKGIGLVVGLKFIGLDSVLTALLLGAVVLLVYNSKKIPMALIMLIIGISITIVNAPASSNMLVFDFPKFNFQFPDIDSWTNGFLRGAVPQIPLTLLNSVIALCALSGSLFPDKKLGVGKVATSVGIMNILSCGFGAFPMCHGSGGLAGQYHFGARTGGSVVMLGIGKIVVGLLFGSSAMLLLGYFPNSILGVLLVFAGLELSLPAKDQNNMNGFLVMILTTIGIIAVNSLVGFLIGVFAFVALKTINKN